MAQTVRVVLRYLDGRNQATPFTTLNVTSTTTPAGFQVHPWREVNGLPVVDVPVGEGHISISAQLNAQSLSTFWTYKMSDTGELTKDKREFDTQIRNKQLAPDINNYEIDIVDANVVAVDTAASNWYQASPSSTFSYGFPADTTRIATDQIEREELFNFSTSSSVQPYVYLFFLRHSQRPKLLAMAIPKGLTKIENILLFYHHTLGQNATEYKGAPYPFGEPYINFGVQNYFGAGGRGLAYQLAAANKNLAMVMPVPDAGPGDYEEVGKFDKDPVFVKNTLEEVIAHFNRRFHKTFTAPTLKELCIGHYSGGILHTKTLMKAPGPLAKLITEIYDIDGLYSSYGHGLTPTSFSSGRVVRTYRQIGTTTPSDFAELAKQNVYALSYDRWLKTSPPNLNRLTDPKKKAADLALDVGRKNWVHAEAPMGFLYHALMKRKA